LDEGLFQETQLFRVPLRALGKFVGGYIERVGSRDLESDLLDQLLEVIRASYEVRLAIDLHKRPNPTVVMDVRMDYALCRLPFSALGSGLEAPLPENRLCLLEISICRRQRVLAVQHSGASQIAQSLNILAGKGHVQVSCVYPGSPGVVVSVAG